MDFVGNLLLFPAVKNFENRLRIDKVIAMVFDVLLFGGHSVVTEYMICILISKEFWR